LEAATASNGGYLGPDVISESLPCVVPKGQSRVVVDIFFGLIKSAGLGIIWLEVKTAVHRSFLWERWVKYI
jgi:hypothetical protein